MNMGSSMMRFATFALFLVLSCVILIGCDNVADIATDSQNETPVKNANSSNKNLVAFSLKSINYYFFLIEHESLKRAVEKRGWEFESAVADFDPAKQTYQFINFIAKKPIALICDPIDSMGLAAAINKAKEKDVPVGIIDTPMIEGNVNITVSFDNYMAGQMAANEIVKHLEKKYGTPKGVVFNAYGDMNSWAWRLRRQGFEDIIKEYPDIEYIGISGEGNKGKSYDALIKAYNLYPHIDAVHCPSDTPARGLVEVLKQKGKWFKAGEKDHVIFVTIDGEPIAIKYIMEGYYDASIVQDVIAYGEIVTEFLDKYVLQGLDIPIGTYLNEKYYWKEARITEGPSGPYIMIPSYVLDKSNCEDPRHWANIAEKDWGYEYK